MRGDLRYTTTLDGLRLRLAGSLSMDDHPAAFTSEEEVYEEARDRMLAARIIRQIGTRGAARRPRTWG